MLLPEVPLTEVTLVAVVFAAATLAAVALAAVVLVAVMLLAVTLKRAMKFPWIIGAVNTAIRIQMSATIMKNNGAQRLNRQLMFKQGHLLDFLDFLLGVFLGGIGSFLV